MSEQLSNKGLPTCNTQVTSKVEDEVRYNSNNAWNVNLNNGNVNNNNTYNRYYVCGASELSFNIDEWIAAEEDCFKNKHSSATSSRIHYRLGLLWDLAKSVASNTYKPGKSYCFVLSYPVYREIFAAYPMDRIVHHYVAPFITKVAECVHNANGNISHGNRRNFSSLTYAKQIQSYLKTSPSSYYVARLDISGFFMSINRQKAYDVLEKYAYKYYTDSDLDEKLRICKVLILSDPTKNCERVGDLNLVKYVADNKSLFKALEGCGLPIGNFYSQLIANLFLAVLDEALIKAGILVARFVDDITLVGTLEQINKAKQIATEVTAQLGLKLNLKKYYIQHVFAGIKTCGYVVYPNRMYLNNRTIKMCVNKIKEAPSTLEGATSIYKTVNSYLGFLKHCSEFNTEKYIVNLVLDKFDTYLSKIERNKHLILKLKPDYNPKLQKLYLTNTLNQFYQNEARKMY